MTEERGLARNEPKGAPARSGRVTPFETKQTGLIVYLSGSRVASVRAGCRRAAFPTTRKKG